MHCYKIQIINESSNKPGQHMIEFARSHGSGDSWSNYDVMRSNPKRYKEEIADFVDVAFKTAKSSSNISRKILVIACGFHAHEIELSLEYSEFINKKPSEIVEKILVVFNKYSAKQEQNHEKTIDLRPYGNFIGINRTD